MFLPKGKKYNTDNVKININGNEIKQVNFIKFLGIYIDEHLSWAQHIEFLSKKIARNVGILSKLKHFLPMYIMNMLYYSLILSHLQYCTLLWANTYSTCLNKLRILQKKAIRIITQSHYLAHTDPLFSKLKLILSHLQYCTLLWANTYSTCLNKLRILQKKAIRIITQSHYLAHTDPLFSKLKLLKLDDLYKHQLGIYNFYV